MITIAKPYKYNVPQPSDLDVKRAVAILQEAKRPVFLLGSQITYGQELVQDTIDAIEAMGVPTYLTSAARGFLGPQNPIQYRHKRKEALKEADVVVCFGVSLDFRLDYGFGIPSRVKLISCNRSKTDLYLNRTPSLAILADPATFAKKLAYTLPKQSHAWSKWHTTLRTRDNDRETEIARDAQVPANKYMNPVRACQIIQECVGDNAVMVGDGGDFVATISYTVRPRKALGWLDPGLFGTLGVGAGFALAAKLVDPTAEVWLFWGDGASGFSLMEYDTMVRHNIPVISVVGNDAAWRQITRAQEMMKDPTGTLLAYTDYHVTSSDSFPRML